MKTLRLLGTIRLRSGDPQSAVTHFAKAARYSPGDDALLEELGVAQLAASEYGGAEATFRRAIALASPQRAALHTRLAMSLEAQGKHDAAEHILRRALELHPRDYVLLLSLGNLLARVGRTADALECFHRAASVEPSAPDAYLNIGVLLEAENRFEEAAHYYSDLVARFPGHHDAHVNLGIVYERLGRNENAIDSYRKALAVDPGNIYAYANLGAVLRTVHQLREAKAACLEALRMRPDFTDAIINLAGVLGDEGDIAGALRQYEKALALDPDNQDAHMSRAMLLLAAGDFQSGWAEYTWRSARRDAVAAALDIAATLPDDLAGRSVLLLGEQGIGDQLFFLRFAPALKPRGARICVQCDPKLETLLRRTDVFEIITTPDKASAGVDLKVMLGDLPLLLEHGGMPTPPPLFLAPLAERLQRVAHHLAMLAEGPYIGLTWRAGIQPSMPGDRPGLYKSVPLDVLAAALRTVPGTLLALQRNPLPGELDALGSMLGRPVHDFSSANNDLEEMLALLYALDDYIGVSNTNMHLMASLGRRARVLVPNPPEWRWMWGGERSPWFPGFKIYREMPGGGWQQAIDSLAADVALPGKDPSASIT